MMGAFRRFANSWAAKVLIALLIVTFGVLGYGASNSIKPSLNTDIVVKAGSQEVSKQDFKQEFEQRLQIVEQQAGRPITQEEAVAGGLDGQLLKIVAADASFAELIKRLGVKPGDKLVSAEIAKTPSFFDPITGRFDRKAYETGLARNGLTPQKYEALMARDIAKTHALGALGLGIQASQVYGVFQAAYEMQMRDVQFFAISPRQLPPPAKPTDAQLGAFLRENAAQATKPEFRQLTIVRFSAKALASSIQVTPAQIQQIFDFRKDSLSKVETRTVVQIPAKDAASAAAISARMTKGEAPTAVAQSIGATPITYEAKPKTAIADRKVADAAFALAAGQSSGPIQGELGYAVVKVLAITPGKTVTLDMVRPQVVEEARARAAEQKISELSDQFEKAYSGGANMTEAARAVGLTPISTAPVAANGAALDRKPATGLSAKLLETAFKLPEGGDSEVLQDAPGEYYIVRVEKVIPPALPTVDEIRGPLTQAYMSFELQTAAKARADALAARVRKGETIEAVAASAGTRAAMISGINQLSIQAEAAKLGGPLTQSILAAKIGEVVVAPSPVGFVVARVTAVKSASPEMMGRIAAQARPQISGQLSQEFRKLISEAASSVVKVKIYPDRAKSAIGVEPAAPAEGKAG